MSEIKSESITITVQPTLPSIPSVNVMIHNLSFTIINPEFYGIDQAPVRIDYDVEVTFSEDFEPLCLEWYITGSRKDYPWSSVLIDRLQDTGRLTGSYQNLGYNNGIFQGISVFNKCVDFNLKFDRSELPVTNYEHNL